jgi:serine protease Do
LALSSWIYDDLPRAMSEAKASGKPLLVVFRCIPCEACAKLDEDVVERSGPLQKLLDQFVCARIPRANGLDLELFQFDFDQSWVAFMLNPDRTIYGRYGTRSHATRSEDDLSLEGFAKALEGALALHAAYPANRAALLPKTGGPPAAKTPEELPSLKERFKPALDWQGNVVKSCLHCHQVGEAARRVFRAAGQPIPEKLLHPYPNPKVLGLGLDPKEKARVVAVAPGSAAEKAGFRAGDEIATLEGQPILSAADVQWVLHGAGESGALRLEVSRGGATAPLSIVLEPGWRQKGDLSWRASSWDLRRMTTGGLVLEALSDADAAKLGLPNAMLALEVKHVGGFDEHATAKKAGFKKGDVFVSVGGKSGRMTESELMASLARTTKPGDKVPVTVLRAGAKVDLVLPMQ